MISTNKTTMENHHPVFTMIFLLNILQSTGRLFFAFLGLSGGMKQFLDVPISPATDGFLLLMFFILGILGYIAIYGIWQQRPGALKESFSLADSPFSLTSGVSPFKQPQR